MDLINAINESQHQSLGTMVNANFKAIESNGTASWITNFPPRNAVDE
jgi:hypothetical protein